MVNGEAVRIAIIAALILLLAVETIAEPLEYRLALRNYRFALSAISSGDNFVTIELAFSQLDSLRYTLLNGTSAGLSLLESLPPEEFDQLSSVPGLLVLRTEVVFAEPDPSYFLGLAEAHGRAVDRAFFLAYSRTYPRPAWPVYREQQTDYSGCTLFGGGELTDTYSIWHDFRRRFPRSYRSFVKNIFQVIEDEVVKSTCACGDKASVVKELSAFAKRFPDSRAAAAAAKRAQEVRESRSGFRFHCISG